MALELLHPKVREAFKKAGYERLLPIQEKSIPVVLSGNHTLIIAPTGSGKTEAALLSVLSLMLSEPAEKGLRLIYVTPLRALNRDVALRIERLASLCGFDVLVRHGDSRQTDRRRFLKEPPSIMITTPETLTLLLTLKEHREIWSRVSWVIVDEVHELLDSERGAELSLTLERLSLASKKTVQRIGLSATLSDRSVERAKELLAGGRRVEVVKDHSAKSYDIKLVVFKSDENYLEEAVNKIKDLMSESRSTLIFTNTRHTAEHLGALLSRAVGKNEIRVHHGSLSREVREDAEKMFREGEIRALVATSSMELGIDIGSVDLVIQFMSPRQVLTMTQRAGRAGHRYGDVSRAFIVTLNNVYEVLESGVIAWRTEKGHIEDLRPHRESLDALAHQIVAMVAEGSAKTIDDIYEIVSKSGLYSNISKETIKELVSFLEEHKVLKLNERGELSLSSRSLKYLYEVSMIPDEIDYEVYDIVSGVKIGSLGERFVMDKLEALNSKRRPVTSEYRFKFVLSGRVWETLDIDLENGEIKAKPVAEVEGYLPSWEGELIPVDLRVAREVCSLLALAMEDPERAKSLMIQRKLSYEETENVIKVAQETARRWGVPLSFRNPVIEALGRTYILYSCLGSKGNFGLALLVSEIANKWVGLEFEYIPYAIVFSSHVPRVHEVVVKALLSAKKMSPTDRLALIQSSLRRSKAFTFRFYHVAKRMGILDPDAKIGRVLLEKLVEAYRNTVAEREALREALVDKVDLEAVNEFLDELSEPVVVELPEPSPLALQVLNNPYVRKDVATNLKAIALDKIIESKKRYLKNKKVIMFCISCLRWEELTVASVEKNYRCSKCGGLSIAPLPATEWGIRAREAFIKNARGERLNAEEIKIVKEVGDRAGLYLNYASLDLGDYVVMALVTHGVGPVRAKRILTELLIRGERGFFEELLKAEEEYLTTRRFWDKKRNKEDYVEPS
ncbi:MAG: DEAD/DEAH box helicase [Acidilobaceae archaeon]